jgi:hypothetical protein
MIIKEASGAETVKPTQRVRRGTLPTPQEPRQLPAARATGQLGRFLTERASLAEPNVCGGRPDSREPESENSGHSSRCPSEGREPRCDPVAVSATPKLPKKSWRRPRAGGPAWHPGVPPSTRVREGSRACPLRTRPSGPRNWLPHTTASGFERTPPQAATPTRQVGAFRRKQPKTQPPCPGFQRLGSREGALDTSARPTDPADETRHPAWRTAPRRERISPAMGLDPLGVRWCFTKKTSR